MLFYPGSCFKPSPAPGCGNPTLLPAGEGVFWTSSTDPRLSQAFLRVMRTHLRVWGGAELGRFPPKSPHQHFPRLLCSANSLGCPTPLGLLPVCWVYGVYATCPKGIKVHRTFSLWTHVFSMDAVCGYRGVFCQIFLLLRLEPAHDLFSAAVQCTLLGRIRIFYSSLYCFSFNFLCGEISKWIKRDTKG